MSPWLDYDSLRVSVLCIMGLEYPFICVIRQDRLNNDKWSAEQSLLADWLTSFRSQNKSHRPLSGVSQNCLKVTGSTPRKLISPSPF